jgi:hypothetical protein
MDIFVPYGEGGKVGFVPYGTTIRYRFVCSEVDDSTVFCLLEIQTRGVLFKSRIIPVTDLLVTLFLA